MIICKDESLTNETYDTLMLINDLKNIMQEIIKIRISDAELSRILGQVDDYIKYSKKILGGIPIFSFLSKNFKSSNVISNQNLINYLKNLFLLLENI